jgi:chitinase
VEKLETKNPDLKVLISCGGWGPYYQDFSAIASSEANRTKFSNSVVKFIREYGFNGIDIDWEFPVSGKKQTYAENKPGDELGKPDDKHNFSLMLKSISEALATAGKADG